MQCTGCKWCSLSGAGRVRVEGTCGGFVPRLRTGPFRTAPTATSPDERTNGPGGRTFLGPDLVHALASLLQA